MSEFQLEIFPTGWKCRVLATKRLIPGNICLLVGRVIGTMVMTLVTEIRYKALGVRFGLRLSQWNKGTKPAKTYQESCS